MDINCTNQCFYQTDGKCTLNQLPVDAPVMNAVNSANETDCLYFRNSQGLS